MESLTATNRDLDQESNLPHVENTSTLHSIQSEQIPLPDISWLKSAELITRSDRPNGHLDDQWLRGPYS